MGEEEVAADRKKEARVYLGEKGVGHAPQIVLQLGRIFFCFFYLLYYHNTIMYSIIFKNIENNINT